MNFLNNKSKLSWFKIEINNSLTQRKFLLFVYLYIGRYFLENFVNIQKIILPKILIYFDASKHARTIEWWKLKDTPCTDSRNLFFVFCSFSWLFRIQYGFRNIKSGPGLLNSATIKFEAFIRQIVFHLTVSKT